MDTLSKRLRETRELKGLTQKGFADAAGVSIRAVQSYEKDSGKLSMERAHIFAHVLEVHFEWLITGQGNMLQSSVQDSYEPINLNDAALAEDSNIILRYGDMEAGRDMNNDMIDIENMSPVTFQELRGYIKGLANGLRSLFSTKQNGLEDGEHKKKKA